MSALHLPPPLPVDTLAPVRGTRANRVRGWVLIGLGLGLSVAMAVVASSLYQTIAFPNQTANHSRWHGSPAFTRTTFGLFGAIFLLGLTCVGSGTFQAFTGRRHGAMLVPLFLIVPVIIYLAYGILAGPGPAR